MTHRARLLFRVVCLLFLTSTPSLISQTLDTNELRALVGRAVQPADTPTAIFVMAAEGYSSCGAAAVKGATRAFAERHAPVRSVVVLEQTTPRELRALRGKFEGHIVVATERALRQYATPTDAALVQLLMFDSEGHLLLAERDLARNPLNEEAIRAMFPDSPPLSPLTEELVLDDTTATPIRSAGAALMRSADSTLLILDSRSNLLFRTSLRTGRTVLESGPPVRFLDYLSTRLERPEFWADLRQVYPDPVRFVGLASGDDDGEEYDLSVDAISTYSLSLRGGKDTVIEWGRESYQLHFRHDSLISWTKIDSVGAQCFGEGAVVGERTIWPTLIMPRDPQAADPAESAARLIVVRNTSGGAAVEKFGDPPPTGKIARPSGVVHRIDDQSFVHADGAHLSYWSFGPASSSVDSLSPDAPTQVKSTDVRSLHSEATLFNSSIVDGDLWMIARSVASDSGSERRMWLSRLEGERAVEDLELALPSYRFRSPRLLSVEGRVARILVVAADDIPRVLTYDLAGRGRAVQ